MNAAKYDVTGIGNALVDVLCKASDEFVAEQGQFGMIRGTMNLIDQERADRLYDAMPPAIEVSGGSAANTMAGFASFGGKGGFIGKVADDQLGKVFQHDLRSIGVTYNVPFLEAEGNPATGRCLILVTPDADRTMNTYLGAGQELCVDDIKGQEELIANSKVTYMEGYLYDPEHAKEAFREAARIAHAAGQRVSLTLSDPFCVDRHRDDFLKLISGHIDILFCNEEELMSLYQSDNFDHSLKQVKEKCDIVIVTRGKNGAIIMGGDETYTVKAAAVDELVDTTGAGDQFAAGFLYGLTQNMPLQTCGNLGALSAAEVISHIGPRPEITYADLIAQAA